MKAFSLLTALLCLFSSYSYAQGVSVTSEHQNKNPATAPAAFYSSQGEEKTIRPADIDVEIPVYRPRAQVDRVYNTIKESQFFLEVNPLRVSGSSGDIKSNSISNNTRDLEIDVSEFNFKLMPLDFKFGFENESWGSFAEVLIEDGNEDSELVIYGKGLGHKFGGGLNIKVASNEATAKSNGVNLAKSKTKSTEIGIYFYASFNLVNNELLTLDLWNKIGGGYEKDESSNIKIEAVYFKLNPAIDILFKINPKLLIGSGFNFEYQRLGGDIEVTGLKKFEGTGNNFAYELNIIKTKFLF